MCLHMCTLKILWSMSECSGLWKHQSNPACTESVRVFRVLKLDAVRKEKRPHLWLWRLFFWNLVHHVHPFKVSPDHTASKIMEHLCLGCCCCTVGEVFKDGFHCIAFSQIVACCRCCFVFCSYVSGVVHGCRVCGPFASEVCSWHSCTLPAFVLHTLMKRN